MRISQQSRIYLTRIDGGHAHRDHGGGSIQSRVVDTADRTRDTTAVGKRVLCAAAHYWSVNSCLVSFNERLALRYDTSLGN